MTLCETKLTGDMDNFGACGLVAPVVALEKDFTKLAYVLGPLLLTVVLDT